MNERLPDSVLLIGIGNELRGDDAVGRLISRRFRGMPGVQVMEKNGEGMDLMNAWTGAQAVILVDAVVSGSPPGTLHRFDAAEGSIPAELFHCSTHTISVAEAVELARVLGTLPARLALYGVEGKSFTPGSALSPEVAERLETVVEEIQREVGRQSSQWVSDQ